MSVGAITHVFARIAQFRVPHQSITLCSAVCAPGMFIVLDLLCAPASSDFLRKGSLVLFRHFGKLFLAWRPMFITGSRPMSSSTAAVVIPYHLLLSCRRTSSSHFSSPAGRCCSLHRSGTMMCRTRALRLPHSRRTPKGPKRLSASRLHGASAWGCAFFGLQKSFFGIQKTKVFLGIQKSFLGIQNAFSGYKKLFLTFSEVKSGNGGFFNGRRPKKRQQKYDKQQKKQNNNRKSTNNKPHKQQHKHSSNTTARITE